MPMSQLDLPNHLRRSHAVLLGVSENGGIATKKIQKSYLNSKNDKPKPWI